MITNKQCKYCDNSDTEYTCSPCFNNLIYRTDAIKMYGLNKNELENVKCISYTNPHRRSMSCYKYHKDDLYEALVSVIDEMDDLDKRKNNLLNKKKVFDEEILQKQNLKKMIKEVVETVKTFLKKCDSNEYKYVKFYDSEIVLLATQLTDLSFSVFDISITICNKIFQCIKNDKEINDKKIEKDKREIKLCKILILKCESLKYYKLAVTNDIFIDFAKNGDITDIDKFNETVLKITKLVNDQREINFRTNKINAKIKESCIPFDDPRCTYFYNRYINGNLSYEWCENKIKEIVENMKEIDLRKKTITDMIAKKYDELHDKSYVKIVENYDEYKKFVQHGDLKKVQKIFKSTCDHIENEKKKTLFYNTVSKYEKYNDNNLLLKKFLNGNMTLKEIEKNMYIASVDITNFKNNNPPGSKSLSKYFKNDISDKLYNLFVDKSINTITVDNVNNNNFFFLKAKCEMLKFNITKQYHMYVITKSVSFDDTDDTNTDDTDEILIKKDKTK